MTLIILAVLVLLPFLLLKVVCVPTRTLRHPAYLARFGQIYADSAVLKNPSRGVFYPLLILHRYFFLGLLFAAPSFPLF